jgi:hypothetical protein
MGSLWRPAQFLRICPRNPTVATDAWKKEIPAEVLKEISSSEKCRKAITLLGYDKKS